MFTILEEIFDIGENFVSDSQQSSQRQLFLMQMN